MVRLCSILSVVCVLLAGAGDNEAVHREIGLTELRETLGADAPDGSGVRVTQVEASRIGWYFIDETEPQFAGKNFTNRGPGDDSPYGHTKLVAENLYSTESGVAPGVSDIDIYETTHWYDRYILRSDRSYAAPPSVERAQIQNHSWVAYNDEDGNSAATSQRIRRLVDYQVDRDQITAVVSLANGVLDDLPDLLAPAYNVITVGVTDGEHSHGLTGVDVAGRTKPDIVAPSTFTSFAAPLVSGAAALLIQTAEEAPALLAARRPQVVKALLMAGATKEEFPAWTRTWFRPLDREFGAGELNINKAHAILRAGRPRSGSSQMSGWDYGEVGGGLSRTYTIDVPEGYMLRDISAVLTWHRDVRGVDAGRAFEPEPELADLDLRLRRAGEETPVDESLSSSDNVEHIWQRLLPAGQYTLEVSADTLRDYGIAWRSELELQPRILGLEESLAGTLVRASGVSGRQYDVQTTVDFVTWTTVGQVTFQAEEIRFPLDNDAPYAACRLVPVID